jgi:hypothetical protein
MPRLLPLLTLLFTLIFATPLAAADIDLVSRGEDAPGANGKLCGYSSIQEGGFVVELYTVRRITTRRERAIPALTARTRTPAPTPTKRSTSRPWTTSGARCV